MAVIDWRDLYAANRAEIGRQMSASLAVSPLAPGRGPAATGVRLNQRPHRAARADGGLSYVVHAPVGVSPGQPAPLVMVLHGCTQDAASIAAGTRMNDVADRFGFVVVYPQQARGANPQGCWNWFASSHQSRDHGEPALLAGVVRDVMSQTDAWSIDPARIMVAGMSAGGAMAGVMAATYPDLFAAVAVHSGVAFGAATNLPGALAAMSGSGPDPARLGELAVQAMSSRARPVPAIVVHGGRDRVVAPINGDRVVQQWMATNGLIAADDYAPDFARPSSVDQASPRDGHRHTCARWRDRQGRLVQEYVRVQALGHAWSGGAAGASYTDPRGPSASELIWRFFTEVV